MKKSSSEDAGAALVCVLRGTDDTNYTGTVDFTTTDVTATNGLDYISTNTTLSFAPGESAKVVTIPILNNGAREPTRYFQMTLSNPTGGGTLGSLTTAIVYVQDNDPGLGFEKAFYTTAWGQTNFVVNVVRGNDVSLHRGASL